MEQIRQNNDYWMPRRPKEGLRFQRLPVRFHELVLALQVVGISFCFQRNANLNINYTRKMVLYLFRLTKFYFLQECFECIVYPTSSGSSEKKS